MSRVLPILFNTEMVRATLDGRKTVTRRIVKDCNISDGQEINKNLRGQFEVYNITPRCGIPQGIIFKPPYQPGDILYVREKWNYAYDMDDSDKIVEGTGHYVYYADDQMPFSHWVDPDTGEHKYQMPWHPSIHMPKEAARIWLKVTDVRVERLQDITDEQVLKEGISKDAIEQCMAQFPEATEQWVHAAHFLPFSDLWNHTIKKADFARYGWNANPWVWVIEFECCGKPEEG